MKTFSDVTNITILMLIFIICYVLIGLELFAYKLKFQDSNYFSIDY